MQGIHALHISLAAAPDLMAALAETVAVILEEVFENDKTVA
jgi:hypothetical protein